MANEQNLIPVKKGEVRNPKGRGHSRGLSTVLREYLESTMKNKTLDPVTRKKLQVTTGEAITFKLIAKALRGNLKAIEEIYNRVEGKPAQTHRLDPDSVGKITVEYAN